ncbi:MAG: HAMP domain-containing sensor histidine kinase [Archaeoglobales archaeon]|nr:HAMP domain-containing sensor histidine kinase [Archaeoglobales archaeon]
MIQPKDPRSLLYEFGREVMLRFDLDCFYAEMPALKISIKIPEAMDCRKESFYEGKAVKIWLSGDADEYIKKSLEKVFEKLDSFLFYLLYQEVWKKLLESHEDIFILADEEGKVVEMNKRASEVFGLLDKIPEECKKDLCERNGRIYSIKWYDLGLFKAIVGRDVTQIEKERLFLKELKSILELINRTMRHDITNALTSSIAFLEIFEDTKNPNLLKNVRKSLDRCLDIIKNMRAFEESIRKGEIKALDVVEVVRSVLKNFEFNIEVLVEDECKVIADEGLYTVIENIVQNAIQHSNTDKITIKIKKINDVCEISIADYGKGIPDEIKEKIFEEGFSYGEKAQSGWGLFVVKQLVHRYHGEVFVEDNIPRGAKFVIRLKCV